MNRAEELIGQPVPKDIELAKLVTASCAEFRSSHGAMEAFWGAVGLHAGDFDLEIYRCDPNQGSFGDRCSAFCAALYEGAMSYAGRRAPDVWTRDALELIQWIEPELTPEEQAERRAQEEEWGEPAAPRDWTGAPAGEALWSLGSLGSLCWDWRQINRRAGFTPAPLGEPTGAYMQSASGEEFIARVFLRLPWDAGLEEVNDLGAEALRELALLPQPVQGVGSEQFADFIRQDMEHLRGLCADGGTVASGLSSDPMSPIQDSLVARETGNVRLACFETGRDWFGVQFLTS